MSLKHIQKYTTLELVQIAESAKKAEYSRDIELLRNHLQPILSLIENIENLEEFDTPIDAELLRLCGFYLTFSGRARNLTTYQDRAKDLITRAIRIFDEEKLDVKSAESKITLAFCYWNRGEVGESEALLSLVEMEFAENKLHPVYLQLQINRMMQLCWDQKISEALAISDNLVPLMVYCTDLRLRIMFHFETAILMHRLERHLEAVFHFTESISLSKKDDNKFLLALNYNNLSLLYLDMKNFKEANHYSDLSFQILDQINYEGWMAHILDSKALICLEENKNNQALRHIEKSLHYFYKSEDYKGLTAALWTKIRCLIRLNQTIAALSTFSELHKTALENISAEVADRFSKRFADEIYVIKRLPLLEEIAEFKRSQIRDALLKSKGKISEAAQILKLKNHQTLSDILKNQFPDLYNELGFKRRKRLSKKHGTKDVVLNTKNVKNDKRISPILLENKNFSFDFQIETDEFETYYFDKFSMTENFGIKTGAVVAVVQLEHLCESSIGKNVLIEDEDVFIAGQIDYDNWADVYFLTTRAGEPFPFENSQIKGEIIGFCPIKETENKSIKFSKIS